MAATYRQILTAIKEVVEAITISGTPNTTNVIIAAQDTDLTDVKGMALIVISPMDRPIGEVGKFAGGLHQVTTMVTIKTCVRVNLDQVAEDATRLTDATMGLLAVDEAIAKTLIREKLTTQLGAANDLDESMELIAHTAPRTRPGGWVIAEQRWRAMYSMTVTAYKA